LNNLLPDTHGTYILCLQLKTRRTIQIGKLGSFYFNTGFYFYIGSAFGPGGLHARCGHHLGISQRPRWHIDYLRQYGHLQQIIYSTEPEHLEHQWATIISTLDNITLPVTGFGSSDCNCTSHLFFSQKYILHNRLMTSNPVFKSVKYFEIS